MAAASLRTETPHTSPRATGDADAPIPAGSTAAKVRVAILVADGLEGRGGIERGMTYLTRHLALHAPDIETSVLRTRYGASKLVRHLSVPAALAAFIAKGLTGRFEVVHLNLAPMGSTWRKMLFAWAAQAMGKRLVVHLHGSAYDEYYAELAPFPRGLVHRLFTTADKVVALSPFWADFLAKGVGLPADRIAIIPNGVPEAVPDDARGGQPPLLVFLGEIGPRKGADVLVEALSILAGRGRAWRAVMGGNGDVEGARAQAATAGIADRIEFPGWVGEGEVDAWLRKADVFVLPSRAENQPIAILEAMARGAPVVSTRVGGIPEQVADGDTGLLVPPEDAVALADALDRLILDPQLRTGLGEAGRRRFAEVFSVAACAARFETLYRSLAGSSSKR